MMVNFLNTKEKIKHLEIKIFGKFLQIFLMYLKAIFSDIQNIGIV